MRRNFCDQCRRLFSKDQTSNGEVKGIDDEGKIKPAGSKPR
jgi:hypothetical protein